MPKSTRKGTHAFVHYLVGKKYINRSGKCHSGLARQEISKTTSLTVLPVSKPKNTKNSLPAEISKLWLK